MINVFLDTNVFRKDPRRNKIGFEVLSKLAKSKFLQIHLSPIVCEEFLTWLISDEKAVFDDALKGIEKLTKRKLSKKDDEKLDSTTSVIKKIKSNRISSVRNSFKNWLKEVNAIIHEIKAHHGASVVKSYFKGLPPFSTIKSRKDFPDAFIWEVIIDLHKEKNDLIVITEDNNFKNVLLKLDGIEVYNKLEDFISSSQIQLKLFDRFGEIYFERIINNLKSDTSILTNYLQNALIDEIAGEYLTLDLEVDVVEAYIDLVDEIEDFHFDFDLAEYYGDGLIGVPLSFNATVYADYSTHFGYVSHIMDTRPTTTISSGFYSDDDWEFQEEVGLYCEGFISIQLSNVNTKELVEEIKISKLLTKAKIDVDSIENIEVTT